MHIFKRITLIGIMSIISAFCIHMLTFAATIGTVKISISADVTVGTRVNDDDISASSSGAGYYVESATFLNDTFYWEVTDVPKVSVHLIADTNYKFSVSKADDIKITGGDLIQAKKENVSKDLIVEIELPALNLQTIPITEATLSNDGMLTWMESEGSGGYQVKFYRNGSVVGGVQDTTLTSMSCRSLMTKAGVYSFKVRPVSLGDASKTGAWFESNTITVGDSLAQTIREENISTESAGTWIQDEEGWWFKNPDGSFPVLDWKRVNNLWYYFNERGYMVTGWRQVGNDWYYLDMTDGYLWVNTTTPDGYYVGISGAYSTDSKITTK